MRGYRDLPGEDTVCDEYQREEVNLETISTVVFERRHIDMWLIDERRRCMVFGDDHPLYGRLRADGMYHQKKLWYKLELLHRKGKL